MKKVKEVFGLYYKHKLLIFMFLPVLVFMILFNYIPMVGISMAFMDYYPLKGFLGSEWVGLKHFNRVFKDPMFFSSFRNTLIISFEKLIFGFPAPIILAILLNEVKNAKAKKFFQTITYMPHFLSWVVLAGVFNEFLSPSRGVINYLIKELGGKTIYFMADTTWFRPIVVITSIWKEVGWGSIIYLAAITNIDPELYDVASIDGAGPIRKIINITIPCIMPTIATLAILNLGGIVNDDFGQLYNMQNANVLSVGEVLSTYTYKVGLLDMKFSYSTAVGLFKTIISFTLVLFANFAIRKMTDNESGIF